MSHLHKEARHHRLANVGVVVFAGEIGAVARHLEAIENAAQLRPHVVRRLERTVLQKVFVAPVVALVGCVR